MKQQPTIITKDWKIVAPILWTGIKLLFEGLWIIIKIIFTEIIPLIIIAYLLFFAPDILKVLAFIICIILYWGRKIK